MPTPRRRGATDAFPEGTTLSLCGAAGVAELSQRWHEVHALRHTLIVSEQDTDDDVFFILSGHARAASYTDRGREVMLSEFHAGEAFGIFAAIDGQPRSTSVVAVEESWMGRMSGADFREVLFGHPQVNRAFIHYLVDRIRSTSSRFTTVASLNSEQRLIAELLRLAQRGRTGPDAAVIDPVPTQQELALLIFAAHREAVGRDMSKLKRAGLIERQGRALRINSLERLRERLAG